MYTFFESSLLKSVLNLVDSGCLLGPVGPGLGPVGPNSGPVGLIEGLLESIDSRGAG